MGHSEGSGVRFNSLSPSPGSCNLRMMVLEMAVITFLPAYLTPYPHANYKMATSRALSPNQKLLVLLLAPLPVR